MHNSVDGQRSLWSTGFVSACALPAVLVLVLVVAPATAVAKAADEVPQPPANVQTEIKTLALAGHGDFNVLFWDVYVAALWSGEGVYKPTEPHALVLRYEREFKGEAIADRSRSEMEDIGAGTPAQREQWHAIMVELFPTVQDGDQLTGVHYPGERSVFYKNEELIGEVADPEFGPAFFGIWLNEKTNAPELRRKLLGRT